SYSDQLPIKARGRQRYAVNLGGGARPGQVLWRTHDRHSLPEWFNGSEIGESDRSTLGELSDLCPLLSGYQAGDESAAAQQLGICFSLLVQHSKVQLFVHRDVIERAEAVLDALRCIQECDPAACRFPARKDVRDEFRNVTKFFHRDPQLMALGGIELIESLRFLHNLLAPPSQLCGSMDLDRPLMSCARGLIIGMAPLDRLDPGGNPDQKIALAVRCSCVTSCP